MANVSKYNFDEVEKRLDTIRFDLGSNKVLLGNGTYGELDLNTVVTTETVENVVKEQVSASVKEQVKEQVSVADDSDIDSLFS